MFKNYKKIYTLGFILVGIFSVILLISLVCCFLLNEYFNENNWILFILIPLIVISISGTFVGIFILKKANKIKVEQLLKEDKKKIENDNKSS